MPHVRYPGDTQDEPEPEDDQDNDDRDDEKQAERAIGSSPYVSGPLVDAEELPTRFRARLTRRWSHPLSEDARREMTDQIETLSAEDAHMVQRFLAPPGSPPVPQPSVPDPLPEMETAPLPPRPQPVPTAGPLSRRGYATASPAGPMGARAHARAAAVISAPLAQWRYPDAPEVVAPAVVLPAPLDLARLILRSWHVALRDEWLPAPVLARLDVADRRLWLAPRLLPRTSCGAPGGPGGMSIDQLAQCIEARPVVRFLLAALWAVTQSEMPAGTPAPARVLTARFAPASGLTRHAWHRWHGAWYTRVIRQTGRLLAPHVALDRLTATYLNVSEQYVVPRLGAERRRAVLENGLRIFPALRAGCQTPQDMERATWAHYVGWLARMASVPACVIADRLAGDTRTIRTPDDLCAWTDDVLAGSPELGHWRLAQTVASGLWSDTGRGGVYRTVASRVALWLAEPGG